MKRYLIAGLLLLASCTAQQQTAVTQGLATVPGQLFCAIVLSSGAQIVAPIVQSAKGAAGAAAVIATDATALVVQQQCAAAAQAVGGKAGAPVAPPPNADKLAPVAIPSA
jgi:hypothetical protein